jgi:putative exosortase-associated protein (TIGR04073 family)
MNKIAIVNILPLLLALVLFAPSTCPADGMPEPGETEAIEAITEGDTGDSAGDDMEEAAQPQPVPPLPVMPAAAPVQTAPPPAQAPVIVSPAPPVSEPEVRVVRPEEPAAQAAPPEPAPVVTAPQAPPAAALLPPSPGEKAAEDAGPYWTEKTLEPRPFIDPKASYPEKALRKFGRGVANIVTSPVELINQPLNYLYRTGPSGVVSSTTALIVGIPVGVAWVVIRAAVGVFDVISFVAPPFQSIIKPEFVSNDFQRRRVLQIKSREEMERRLPPRQP